MSITHTNDSLYELESNARLIAAAPDLLAACKYTLAAFDAQGWTASGSLQVQRGESIKLLKAAIKQAEGEL